MKLIRIKKYYPNVSFPAVINVKTSNLDDFLSYFAVNDEYSQIHKQRFMHSFSFLKQYLDREDYSKILVLGDMGRRSAFIYALKYFYQDKVIDITNFDVRSKRYPFRNETYSIIICMEIIEHLADIKKDYMLGSGFYGTGINNMLSECRRILRPDGILFITIPNVNAYNNIYNLLNFEHPFLYKLHQREFSFNDIREFIEENKLKITQFQCLNCWDWSKLAKHQIEKIKDFIKDIGLSNENRNDDMFFIIQKDLNAKNK